MFDFDRLNSATKYPSILTYHALGERGPLTDERTHSWHELHEDTEVVLTEKVDGTNARVIRMPDGDWFIGCREELLTCKGDRVANPMLGIVEAVRGWADQLTDTASPFVQVFFVEVYGHKIGRAAGQYTGEGKVGFRLFDAALVSPTILSWEREEIASWREHGGQAFATEEGLWRAAKVSGAPLVPRLGTVRASALPTDVEGMHTWLTTALPATQVALDDEGRGAAEGIVLRTKDRRIIAKARCEDYARTLKRRQQPEKGGKR